MLVCLIIIAICVVLFGGIMGAIALSAKIGTARIKSTEDSLVYNPETFKLTLEHRIPANKKVFKLKRLKNFKA